MTTPFHLAQLNIGLPRAPLDSAQLAGFVAALAPINALADAAPGFVWRLQTEEGNATSIRAFDDDRLIVNMSVWESIQALATFVYSGPHLEVMRQRRRWFEQLREAFTVLWWVPAGYIPTVAEAKDRLVDLRVNGPNPRAFTFKEPFPSPAEDHAAPSIADWLCPA